MMFPRKWFKDRWMPSFYRFIKAGRGPYGWKEYSTGRYVIKWIPKDKE